MKRKKSQSIDYTLTADCALHPLCRSCEGSSESFSSALENLDAEGEKVNEAGENKVEKSEESISSAKIKKKATRKVFVTSKPKKNFAILNQVKCNNLCSCSCGKQQLCS